MESLSPSITSCPILGVDTRTVIIEQKTGITIKGGAWDIPTIDTGRQDNGRGGQIKPFRVEEFEHVLRVVGEGVDFVWVDVACIDQNPLLPDKADQIGKQASIFQLASHAFV